MLYRKRSAKPTPFSLFRRFKMLELQLYMLKFALIEFFGTPVYSGVRVAKLSGKPFKSGHKINTVKGLTCNPNTNLLSYTFVEDNSIVDCKQVYEV